MTRPVKGTLTTVVILGLAGVAAFTISFRDAHRTVTPAELLAGQQRGTVQLVGLVAAASPRFGTPFAFVLTDPTRSARIRVRYNGAAAPFRAGERVSVTGTYRNQVFVAQPDTLITNCAGADRREHC